MANLRVEREQEIGRILRRAERAHRALRDLGEVGLAALGEHQLQLGGGAREELQYGAEHFPLVVGVALVGHAQDGFERGAQRLGLLSQRDGIGAHPPGALVGERGGGEVGRGLRVQRAGAGQDARAFGPKRQFELRPRGREAGLAQPLVALREHGGDEVGGDLDVVVEMQQELRRSGRELVHRAQRRFAVMLVRVLDDAGLRAESRDHRHLARERGAEGVDGLDAKAMPDVAGVLELGENPAAHLGRRLDGEGDGYHLLGLLHRAEEPDVALHQQLGLARAGGRLDDERAARVEGGFASSLVRELFGRYAQATGIL